MYSKKLQKDIKAIIFDLDGTLYDYKKLNQIANKKVEEYICENYTITEKQYKVYYLESRKYVKKRLKNTAAEHNRLLYFQHLMELLEEKPVGVALKLYHIYWETLLNNIKLYDGVMDILKFCIDNKIKIAICTDLTVQIQHRKIEKLKLEKYIDCLVTSEEIGVEKPNSQMYDSVVKKLGIEPIETIFVGDSWERDVQGAIQYGITPLWFNPCGEIKEEKEIIEISNHKETRELFE